MKLTKLTEREKKLIYIMGCLLIVVIGYFFVLVPQTEKLTEAGRLLDKEKIVKAEMEQSINEVSYNKERKTELKSKVINLCQDFYRPMKLEVLDERVTGTILRSGITPQSLLMTEFAETKISSYTPGTVGANVTPGSEDVNMVEKKTANFKSSSLTLSVKGSKSEFLRLIDKFSANKSIMIKNFTLTEPGNTSGSSGGSERAEDLTAPQGSNILMPSGEKTDAENRADVIVDMGQIYSINIDVFTYKPRKY